MNLTNSGGLHSIIFGGATDASPQTNRLAIKNQKVAAEAAFAAEEACAFLKKHVGNVNHLLSIAMDDSGDTPSDRVVSELSYSLAELTLYIDTLESVERIASAQPDKSSPKSPKKGGAS
ncbi:MAG: hypothetical protein DHS20C01_14970 [marine bacterium B5-7]|nr:MAG: hypothetical protein DHS20C01_14970 [marine bacterium B5-7]